MIVLNHEEQEIFELYRVFLGMLPDDLRHQITVQLLSRLASGWRPDPENEASFMRTVKLIIERKRTRANFDARNEEKQAQARLRRPALIAMKYKRLTGSPAPKNEKHLNQMVANEASVWFGKRISEKQVREATQKLIPRNKTPKK